MSNSSSDLESRIARCFQLAFPTLSEQDVRSATSANTPGWDSIAQITLVSVIGEELGVDVDFEAFEGVTSFADAVDAARRVAAVS